MSQNGLYENELYLSPSISIAEEKTFPLHQHRHIEMICVTSGKMTVNINGRSKTLSVGDAAFFAPYILHGYSSPDNKFPRCFKLLFEPEVLGAMGNLLLEYIPEDPIISSEKMHQMFPDLSEKLVYLQESFSKPSQAERYMHDFSVLCDFVAKILGAASLEKSDKTDTSLFIRAVRVCCEKYTEESFNVSTLSRTLGATPARLQQLFSKNLNLAVKEYITLLRMSKADSYLADTDMNILDIAYHCGYGTVRSFNRAFQRTHGKTPSEFKKSCSTNSDAASRRMVLSNFDLFYTNERRHALFFNDKALEKGNNK